MSDAATPDDHDAAGNAVAEFLRSRGCPDDVVRGGVAHLLARWRSVLTAVIRGYPGDLDEYLNDMDVRQTLHDLDGAVGLGEAVDVVARIDRQLNLHLVPARDCLWGADNAAKHNWFAESNWWYFTHPRKPGPALRAELEERGLWSDRR